MDLSALQKNLIAVQEGNTSSFTFVYEDTHRILYQAIYFLVTSKEETEDILQETYLKALEHDWKNDTHSNPMNFLLTIAKNIAFNHLKKRKRHERIEEEHQIPSSYHENQEGLLHLLPQFLKKEELLIVYLHVVEEWSHQEIASLLHRPLGTITWKYQWALKKIKKRIGDAYA